MSTPSTASGEPAHKETPNIDIERGALADSHPLNTTVHSLAWKGITVTVKDRETKLPKNIVDDVHGFVEAGMPRPLPPPPSPNLPLTPPLTRRNPRPPRPLRQRQNHAPQPPGDAPQPRRRALHHGQHLAQRHPPTPLRPHRPPLRNPLRRARRLAGRRADGAGDASFHGPSLLLFFLLLLSWEWHMAGALRARRGADRCVWAPGAGRHASGHGAAGGD